MSKVKAKNPKALAEARQFVSMMCRCGHWASEHEGSGDGACRSEDDICLCPAFKRAPLVVNEPWDLQRMAKKALVKSHETPKGGSRRDAYLSALRTIAYQHDKGGITIEAAVHIAKKAMTKPSVKR